LYNHNLTTSRVYRRLTTIAIARNEYVMLKLTVRSTNLRYVTVIITLQKS